MLVADVMLMRVHCDIRSQFERTARVNDKRSSWLRTPS